MTIAFVPCGGCQRHIRSNEAQCPFCSHKNDVRVVRPVGRTGRLSRAALFAFGTSIAATATGCGSTTTPGNDSAVTDTQDVQGVDGDDVQIGPLYGGPPADVIQDDGEPMARYGSPPPPDAG